jgi:hypothetical protein
MKKGLTAGDVTTLYVCNRDYLRGTNRAFYRVRCDRVGTTNKCIDCKGQAEYKVAIIDVKTKQYTALRKVDGEESQSKKHITLCDLCNHYNESKNTCDKTKRKIKDPLIFCSDYERCSSYSQNEDLPQCRSCNHYDTSVNVCGVSGKYTLPDCNCSNYIKKSTRISFDRYEFE